MSNYPITYLVTSPWKMEIPKGRQQTVKAAPWPNLNTSSI